MNIQFSKHQLKRLSFPHSVFLAPLPNIGWPHMLGFIFRFLILFYRSICLLILPSYSFHFSSVQFSLSVASDSLRPHESQHTRTPCPSPTPGPTQTHVHLVGDTIQPLHPAAPFSSCLQSFPASGSFQTSQLFASKRSVS